MKTFYKKFVAFFKKYSLRRFVFLSLITAMLFLTVGMSVSRMIVYSKTKNSMVKTNEKYASVLFKQIDTEMKVVSSIINNYLNDSTLQMLSRISEKDYRFMEATMSASIDISRTASENLFVDDIVIVFNNKDVAFSKDGHFSKKYFLSANKYYEKISKMDGQKNVIRTVPYFEKNYIDGQTLKKYDVLLMSVPADEYTVNVMIDYNRLEEIFGRNIAEGKKMVILSENDLIYNNTGFEKNKINSVIEFKEDGFDIKNGVIRIGDAEFFDTYANLQSIGWICHMLFPENMLLKEINVIVTPYVYFYVLILIVTIFLMAAYSKAIIFPLKKLSNDIDGGNENLTGKSEFAMINHYISDMRFKNEQYAEFIENNSKLMQSIILKEIIEKNILVEEESQQMYFGNMKHEKFVLLRFCLISFNGTTDFLNEFIEEFLSKEDCFFRIFECGENCLYVAVNCKDETLIYHKTKAETEKLRDMGNDVFAVASDYVKSVNDFFDASQQIEKIIQYRNVEKEKAFYTKKDIVQKENSDFAADAVKIIYRYIVEKGSDETELCLQKYAKQKSYISYCVYKSFMISIVQILTNIAEEYSIDINKMGFELLFVKESKLINIHKEETMLFDLCCRVAERIAQIKKAEDDRIIDYIRENYSNYISLDIVAHKFCMNPNYLSGYIKKKIGMNYQDFVDSLKLEKAKKLMLETNMTISEIADTLGYDSSSSFIRFFKKYEKETPGAFRSREKGRN